MMKQNYSENNTNREYDLSLARWVLEIKNFTLRDNGRLWIRARESNL